MPQRPAAAVLAIALVSGPAALCVAQDSPPAPPSPPAITAPVVLPPAGAILARAVEAMGGRDKVSRVKDMHLLVTVAMGQRDLEMEMWASGSDKLLIRQPIPQMAGSEIRIGRNGAVCWIEAPVAGVRAAEPSSIEQFAQFAVAHRTLLRLSEDYRSAETTGEETFDDRACFVVRFTDPTPDSPAVETPDISVLFVARTGLPIVLRRPVEDRGMVTLQEVIFSGWDSFGDLRLFREMEVRSRNRNQRLTFEKITFDPVDQSLFDIPPQLVVPSEGSAPAPPGAVRETPPARE